MFLYGKNSTRERLRKTPQNVKQVFLQDGFDDQEIMSLLENNHLPVSIESQGQMEKIKKGERHQGIILEISDFQYSDLAGLLKGKKNLIFLDRLNDPQNLGLIMRIGACFGNWGIVIGEKESCEVNETVLHVASGAENYLEVAKVSDFVSALTQAKEAGYFVAGTDVKDGKVLDKNAMTFPLALILGSEGSGVSLEVAKMADINFTIPNQGAPLSLNVAMAASIICYEISK